MELNEQQKQELTAHYQRRYGKILQAFAQAVGECADIDDKIGLTFLLEVSNAILHRAIDKLPEGAEERTVH